MESQHGCNVVMDLPKGGHFGRSGQIHYQWTPLNKTIEGDMPTAVSNTIKCCMKSQQYVFYATSLSHCTLHLMGHVLI